MRLPVRNFFREPDDNITPIPIAIVGRANVGKSTLFNRMQSGTKKKKTPLARNAIISDHPGTTRDRKDAVAVFGSLVLRLTDTGGLESNESTAANALLAAMREQVWRAVATAEAILFVIDAKEGVTPLDMQIAEMLRDQAAQVPFYRNSFRSTPRETPVPIILVANKAEGPYVGPYLNDCYELGLGDPVVVSAKKNEGMDGLYDRLCLEVGHLQFGSEEDEDEDGDEADEADEEEEEAEGEEGEEDFSGAEEEGEEALDANGQPIPVPTLRWMPPKPLTEAQKRSLLWFAKHPADPLGELDQGLKASVLHKVSSEVPDYWLGAKKKHLPSKEVRDHVMHFKRTEDMEQPLRISIVGVPSTGKSSIINALLQEERCIVDEADGTTMDAIVSNWTFKGQQVKLIDTCGVYRQWRYPGTDSDFLEPGMGTKRAIRKCHVAVLCLDAAKSSKMTYYSCPSRFEVRLGSFVAEEGKCLVIAVNKWDLIAEEDQPKFRDEILSRISDSFPSVKGVPVVFMSAKYNLNLGMLMTRCFAIYKRWSARLPTGKLNNWLQAWMIRWPPPWKDGQKCSIKYITQTRSRPPTFVLWTNTATGDMPPNYMKQMQNAMRDEFRISGVPMRFVIRSTIMPKPGKKLSKRDILKWKRRGPKQAKAVLNLTSKGTVRKRQTD